VRKGAPPPSVIFLNDAVEVDGWSYELEGQICSNEKVLLPMADESTESGEAILMTLGRTFGERVLGVPTNVRLGPCWTREGGVAIPIRWEAAVLGSAFPVLDGTLVITPLGGRRCRLGIEATYRPPLDRFGVLVDRLLLHRVAESTVHDFLQRLASVLAPGS
jgi:hypothetical protein